MNWQHPTGRNPQVIDLISLGPSQREYHSHHHALYNPTLPKADELWTLNKGIRTIKSDMAFILDDLEGERRRSVRYAKEIIEYASDKPVITSELSAAERENWPGHIHNYPLTEIVDYIGAKLAWLQGVDSPTPQQSRDAGTGAALYLYNSVPMILAYALFIGVREVRLFGADYTIRGTDHMEENRPNCEYWVGMLRGMGVRIRVPGTTTLLCTDQPKRIYGYARDPILEPVESSQTEPA